MKYEKLNQKINELKDEIFDSIKESVAIESVRGEATENAPYGEGPKAALEHMLALGEKLGFKTKNVDNRVGWVEYGEGEEMVAVLGHVDVVPLGEGWDYDPLGCEIHDGKMYGRGVMDDKGPVVGAIYALKAIRDLGLPIDRRIRVIFGADEENGSSCVKHYIAVGEEKPTIGFTPDGEYSVCFFEKAQLFWGVSKKVENPSVNVISLEGGSAPNIVTPQCTLTVEGDFNFQASEHISVTKEDGKTIIISKGKGAHGSTPECGRNAAIQLFQALKEQGCDLGGELQTMINFIMDKINTETDGKSLGVYNTDEETGTSTINLGRVEYDAEHVFFTLDTRFPNHSDVEKVEETIAEAAAAYGLDAKVTQRGKMLYVPKDSELVVKLMSVYKEQTGRNDEPFAMGGGTYAKAFDNMVAFGPLFPGEEDVIHQPNEYGDIENMMKGFQVNAAAMYELAQR